MRSFARSTGVLAVIALSATAFAATGNIAITGHDDDFHAMGCSTPSGPSAQLAAMIAFARSGAPTPSLRVLIFDHGGLLAGCLFNLGIAFTKIDPDVGVPASSNFSTAIYSAILVASDDTCGSCDNTASSIANLTAASASFASFWNAGGGIVALAGGTRASTYYGFLPVPANGFGSPPAFGYVQTAFGATVGIPATNGDAAHNFFPNPGTSGVSSSYGVVETLGTGAGAPAETLACQGCTVPFTPPPSAVPAVSNLMLALTAVLLAGAGFLLLRRVAA